MAHTEGACCCSSMRTAENDFMIETRVVLPDPGFRLALSRFDMFCPFVHRSEPGCQARTTSDDLSGLAICGYAMDVVRGSAHAPVLVCTPGPTEREQRRAVTRTPADPAPAPAAARCGRGRQGAARC